MRQPTQHFFVGDLVRHRDTAWTGRVVKTHTRSGALLQSGNHQDVIVRWDRNGRESRVSPAMANLVMQSGTPKVK